MGVSSVDVVVVGAGPAGSHCAAALAERGHAVVLLDRSPRTREHIVCTGIVGAEAFARFDLPVPSVLSSLGKARFFSPAGHSLEYETGQPFAHVVDRTQFDGTLQQRAVARGAELRFHANAEQVQWKNGSILISGRTSGEDWTVEARVAVFAVGFNRPLARQLGLAVPRVIHGVQAEVSMQPLEATELYFGRSVAPGFFAWAVPLHRTRARLGLLARQKGRQLFAKFLSHPAVRGRLDAPVERPTARPIAQGFLPQTAGDRFVVVGEAAGQVKTTTSGGIYYGLIGAQLAAEAIDQAFKKGDLSSHSLGSYHTRWIQMLGAELKAGLRLQSLAASMTDGEIDSFFRKIAGNGILTKLREHAHFDWHDRAIRLLLCHPYLAKLFTSIRSRRRTN